MTARPRHRYGTAALPGQWPGRWLGLGVGALVLATVPACNPIYDYRGFVPQEHTIEQVRIGTPRSQVEQVLGSPSAQSGIDGTRYYYISSTFETVAFLEPEEIDRKIYAITFDEADTVSNLAYYGLKDGKVFDFITRTTPTRGKELTLVQEFFGNIGRFESDRSIVRDAINRR